jgi:hypothetical protein
MSLRRVAPCVLVVLTLCGCGTAADIAGAEPPTDRVDPTSEPPPTTTPTSLPTTTPPTTATTTPKRRPEERPPKQLPHVVGAVRFFASPSENIGCLITSSAVRCDIKQKSYREPAKPASCRLDFGRALLVGQADREATFVCVGDTVLGAGKILRYNTSTEVGDFGCTSRESGMTCYNLRTRHGFLVSREVVDTF